MTASRHLAHLRPPKKWVTLDGKQTIATAVVLFVSVFALQATDTKPADAEEVLYVVPIVLLALRFGFRGGLTGSLAGIALIATWDFAAQEFDVSLVGNLCWAVAFLLLGTLLGSFVDHRRRLEAEISRYFDESLDLLVTADTKGRFTRVNPAWERTLGLSAKALCSRPFIEFVHPDDRQHTADEHAAVASGSRDATGFRNRFRAADGSYRWLEWSGHTSELGGVIHAVARDITIQHDAEQQLAGHAELLEAQVLKRTRELKDARAKTLNRLALAAEYRDDDTFQHTQRVGSTAAAIGIRLGLDPEQVELLREAAPLHDVGKIAIPDCILLKCGRLDVEEYEVMKTHAVLGARLLAGSGSPVLQMATVIAENHHERWDGAGYPAGLAGEAIPLVGRVVAVADVFDALTHDRPYKSAWTVEQALAEIEQCAGGQFDARVVAAFLAIHRGGDTTPVGGYDDGEPTPHENASIELAVRSIAGSTVV
jgi:PAS domain S-box-containing protein